MQDHFIFTMFQVCKYFIEAVEQRKYGWFWECPNGPSCQYVHALPPGFVLKKKEEPKEEVDENDQETIENEIEAEVQVTLLTIFTI